MQRRPATEEDPKLSALTLLHARGCLVALEVHGLLRTGHAAGAQAQWRTLHELAVVAFLLGSYNAEAEPQSVAKLRGKPFGRTGRVTRIGPTRRA